MEDEKIIALYFQRQSSAIEESENKYGCILRRTAFNILSSREDSEECVNDSLLAAWDSIPPERPRSLGAYLVGITRNLSLSRLREGNSLKRGGGELPAILDELAEVLDSGVDIEKELELRELNRAIQNMLDCLGKAERDVFLGRYWFAASISEIAGKSGFSESKIKSMLHRTRKKLLAQLKEEGLC